MHSCLRYSFSYTFSRMTTFPSATEVTSLSEPLRSLFGMRKKASCHTQTQSSIASIGYTSHGMRTRKMKIRATTVQQPNTSARVPREFLSIFI